MVGVPFPPDPMHDAPPILEIFTTHENFEASEKSASVAITEESAESISPLELRIRQVSFGALLILLAILIGTLAWRFLAPNTIGDENSSNQKTQKIAEQILIDDDENFGDENLNGQNARASVKENIDIETIAEEKTGDENADEEIIAPQVTKSESQENNSENKNDEEISDLENSEKSDDDAREKLLDLMRRAPSAFLVDKSEEIAAQLETSLLTFSAQQVAAVEFARTLGAVANVPITIEMSLAEEKLSVDFSAPSTVKEILENLAAQQNAIIVIENNQVSWRRAESVEILKNKIACVAAFPIDDFKHILQFTQLQEFLTTLLPLQAVKYQENTIVCCGAPRVVSQAEQFLEMLRVVSGLPQRTSRTGEKLAPEAFGWDTMQQPITLEIFREMPLETVLELLEKKTGMRILINHAALAASPTSLLAGTVSCENTTFDAALNAFLQSLDTPQPLTYRLGGERILEITTEFAAQQSQTLELHRLTGNDAQRELGKTAFLKLMQNSPTYIFYGDWIFVYQSQPTQRAIRHLCDTTVLAAGVEENLED